MKRKNHSGFFLVIEGADGSGKTTLARRLARVYGRQGWRTCVVREPGGTSLSERVRRLLLDTRGEMTPRAELFLYLAARAQMVDEVIRPALAGGKMVIADRFSLSTLAYQSAGRGLPLFAVAGADWFARDSLTPDLTLVLAVSGAEAERRLRQQGRRRDRMERESAQFYRSVRDFYDRWGRSKQHHQVIDSHLGPDEVLAAAVRAVDRRLRRLRLVRLSAPRRFPRWPSSDS